MNDADYERLKRDVDRIATERKAKIEEPNDEFTTAYIEAMLWSSTDVIDGEDTPLDRNHDAGDLAEETLLRIKRDCESFQKIAHFLINDEARGDTRAGHDFWLTRAGHGAGFWDGDWPEHGEALTELSKLFGELDPYVGDDGKIYF